MSDPPVNVRFEIPTNPPANWNDEAQRWRNLNATQILLDGQMCSGHPGFYPLTIKAAYIIGVIHDLCSAVSYLLQKPNAKDQFYIPAYGIFASSVDILGRCIQGNSSHNASVYGMPDILTGFKWLYEPTCPTYDQVQRDAILVETSRGRYSIDMLISLRHFAAHGQGTTNINIYEFRDIDDEILGHMPRLLARGLDNYWGALGPTAPVQVSELLCNRLAQASIAGFRNGPIYKSWSLFQGNNRGESITNIFQEFNWVV